MEWWIIADSLIGKLTTLTGALLAFSLVDRIFLRWLNIRDVILKRGEWEKRSVMVRHEVIRGWFLLAAVIILGFLIGGAI